MLQVKILSCTTKIKKINFNFVLVLETGKSYTLGGIEPYDGIIPRSFDLVFKHMNQFRYNGFKYILKISMCEINDDSIFDLLDDAENMVTASNFITKLKVDSPKQLKDLLKKNQYRIKSIRSHLITQLHVSCFCGETEIVSGHVTFVDLANTINVDESAHSMSVAENMNELQDIKCILKGLDKKDTTSNTGKSKLSYFLKSTLNVNSKSLLILNTSLRLEDFFQSRKTLQFGSEINNTKMKLCL